MNDIIRAYRPLLDHLRKGGIAIRMFIDGKQWQNLTVDKGVTIGIMLPEGESGIVLFSLTVKKDEQGKNIGIRLTKDCQDIVTIILPPGNQFSIIHHIELPNESEDFPHVSQN